MKIHPSIPETAAGLGASGVGLWKCGFPQKSRKSSLSMRNVSGIAVDSLVCCCLVGEGGGYLHMFFLGKKHKNA
jgi:hypothetical protein